MAGPITRSQLHERLSDALAAMPTVYNGVDLKVDTADTWHPARDFFAGGGVEMLPAHLAHLGFAVEFGRARRTEESQRYGRDGLAEVQGAVYFSFRYGPHGLETRDYRAAMDAAELVAHTLEGGWHAGAATVTVETDWDPRWVEGEALLICALTFTLRHERIV